MKKARPEGYEDGVISLYQECKASEFFETTDPLLMLSQANQIIIDSPIYENSPHTKNEIRECLKDIKVCGPGELRQILMWRRKILEDIKKEERLKYINFFFFIFLETNLMNLKRVWKKRLKRRKTGKWKKLMSLFEMLKLVRKANLKSIFLL